MAFPVNGIIDNFNRSDTGPPPSASWGTAAGLGLRVVSNVVTTNAPGDSDNIGYWNVAIYGDCESYVTMVDTVGNNEFEVWVRLNTPGDTTFSGYLISATKGTGLVRYYRVDNAVFTQLGTSESQTVSDGDGLGVSIVGYTLQAYYRVGLGGTWNALGAARADPLSSYATGYLGLYISGSSIAGDDFGGGALGPGSGADSLPVQASDVVNHVSVTLSIQESG